MDQSDQDIIMKKNILCTIDYLVKFINGQLIVDDKQTVVSVFELLPLNSCVENCILPWIKYTGKMFLDFMGFSGKFGKIKD